MTDQPAAVHAASVTTATQAPAEAPAAAVLSFSTKLFYGIGELPITITMAIFGLFALFFYNSVMGLPAVLVGVGVASGLILDAVLDPYIGYRSDFSRHRFGRRHAFMLPGALAMGPCFFLLFAPPKGMSTAWLFVWLLLCSLIFRTASAIYRIPYLSLGAELSQDYTERTRVIALRSLFGLVGLLAGAGLPFLLFFPSMAGDADPKLNYAGYPKLGLVFGACMTVFGLISIAGTSKYQRGLASAFSKSKHTLGMSFIDGFRISLRNHAFRGVWLFASLFFLAVVLNHSLAVHYFTWYVKIHHGTALSAIQSTFYIGALIGVLFWMIAAKRGEKRSLCLLTTLSLAGLLCLATLLFGEGSVFGTGRMWPLVLGHGVAGFFASVLWVIPASMLADVGDLDELETGFRREGMYFGILNFGEKIASGGALLIAGVLLNFFARLAPGSATQSPQTAERIGILYGLLPGILLALSASMLLRYRLDRRAVGAIQDQLRERGGQTNA